MNSENSESTGIIVLGMHRSGTSLLTKILQMSGAWLGDDEQVSAKGQDNPTGFWEHSAVRSINQCLLEASDANWDSVLKFDLKKVPLSIDKHLRDEAKDVVTHLQNHKIWAIKDPRLCLTLPWWRPIFGNVVVAHICRSPLDIARSLSVRNDMSRETGLALWEYYLLHAVENSAGLPQIVVNYDHMVDDPEMAHANLAKAALKAGNIHLTEAKPQELDQFISPALRHSFSDREQTRAELTEQQWDLYEQIHSGNLSRIRGRKLSQKSHQVLEENKNMPGELSDKAVEQVSQIQKELMARLFTAVSQVNSIKQDYSKDLFDIHNAMKALRAHQIQSEKEISDLGASVMQLKESFWNENAEVINENLDKIIFNLDEKLINLRQEMDFDLIRKMQEETGKGVQGLSKDLGNLKTELRSAQISKGQEKISKSVERLCADIIDLRKELKHINELSDLNQNLKTSFDDSMEQLSKSELMIQNLTEENKVLSEWLSKTFDLTKVTFDSARWKVGNSLVRGAEMMMLRKKPHLAVDVLDELRGQFNELRNQTKAKHSAQQFLSETHVEEVTIRLKADTRVSASSKDIFIFPIIDWNFRIQRPQHIARELAQSGHRIFYFSLAPELNATQPGFEITEKPHPRVHLVTLKLTSSDFPNVYTDFLDEGNRDQLLDAIKVLISELNLSNLISLIDLPFWSPVASSLPGTPVIYDCMDHHGGFSTATKKTDQLENQLTEQCDLLVVTSRWLWDRYKDIPSKCLIPNAGEIEFFSKVPEQTIDFGDGPVVGYVGAIADWFDVDLVVQAAVSKPAVTFVLVGSTAFCDTAPLKKLQNVRLVGEVAYSEVPGYVHAFDCCFIPFQLTELIKATNPVKVYEYLAAGKPVVSTKLPELEPISDLVHLAESADEFVSLIDLALEESTDESLADKRANWASQHDWSNRKDSLLTEMESLYPKVSVIVLCYNNLEFTKSCLKGLLSVGGYPNVEIIMVDNGSTDGTHEYLKELEQETDNFIVMTNAENLGFSAGNNVGIKVATGDYIVLLNNDTYPTPGWIFGLVRHLRNDPELGLISPVTNNIGNEAKIDIHYANMESMIAASFKYTSRRKDKLLFVPTVAFFCVAFSRELSDEVGLLDEQFGQGFFEDDDYCRRVSEAGYKVAIAEDVFVHHHLSATFSQENKEKREKLFLTNKKKFEAKWGKWKAHEYR